VIEASSDDVQAALTATSAAGAMREDFELLCDCALERRGRSRHVSALQPKM
jgi:hypothetical protein